MARPKKIKAVKKEVEDKIKKLSLSLKLSGKEYQTKANSIAEALDFLFKASFGKVKTWGIFTLENEGKKAAIQMRPIQIKRIFVNRFAREMFEKRLTMMLK